MNYRHAFHAGNFADVVKHVALVAILQHLKKKETPFAVIDSHAGRGLYDLSGVEAQKTGEAGGGIARLAGLAPPLPDALNEYLRIVGEVNRQNSEPPPAEGVFKNYPGSPLIAVRLLRFQDRLVAIEKHPEEVKCLIDVLGSFRNAKVEAADGYARLAKLLPPAERRGLILIDPPFEAADEFERLAAALRTAYRRFATGIYLVWYPIKAPGAVDRFIGEMLNAGIARALTIEIALPPDLAVSQENKLARAGLLVVNPPFGFEAVMAACMARLGSSFGTARLQWRAGKD